MSCTTGVSQACRLYKMRGTRWRRGEVGGSVCGRGGRGVIREMCCTTGVSQVCKLYHWNEPAVQGEGY